MLFTDLKNMPNGANFVNVDLHIHSFGASTDVKDPSMTPSAIVEAAVNQGLAVIALTDHNTDRNVAEALTQASKYAGRLLVLPGVEVTTALGPSIEHAGIDPAGLDLSDHAALSVPTGERDRPEPENAPRCDPKEPEGR